MGRFFAVFNVAIYCGIGAVPLIKNGGFIKQMDAPLGKRDKGS
jgi:hypothetical protein